MLQTILDELNGTFPQVSPVISGTRLVTAMVLGGIVGFEREIGGKPAGLRTHMLVSLAACLFIVVGQQLGAVDFGSDVDKRVDPLRLIEAVTAGVAFLAAGIIFTAGGRVRNITTGASMWLAGAIGLACGAGQIPLAAMATVLVVVVIVCLRWIEQRMGTHSRSDEIPPSSEELEDRGGRREG
ncbi:MgtC/SapB family protein [Jannaschia formosa]|uniref:MgtC/SapB family protein n=1 Tax=Jannaschia formosa TaxID=2259592 RepID=UPI000E1B99BF|nr:MgtC/SapB family protein [Jannaschia formosa]TFL18641.1 MgtC/SapB family protein [Jannaschia formosa]